MLEGDVIDLVSSEPEVIEILSSPRTPDRRAAILSFSPLFEQELADVRALSAEAEEVSNTVQARVEAPPPPIASNMESSNAITKPPKRAPKYAPETEATPPPAPAPAPPQTYPALTEETFVTPTAASTSSTSTTSSTTSSRTTTMRQETDNLAVAVAASVAAPAKKRHVFKSPDAANKRARKSVPASKSSSNTGRLASASKATKKTSSSASAAPLMTRIKAGDCLHCSVFDPSHRWAPLLRAELENIGCPNAVLSPEEIIEGGPQQAPKGVELLLRTFGRFEDEWSAEQQTFVKTGGYGAPSELIDLGQAFVVLGSEQFEVLAKMPQPTRAAYFAEISALVPQSTRITFFFPEFAQQYKKRIDQYNREIRKRVSTYDDSRIASLPPLEPPPNEESYTQTQTALEVFHGVRAVYPRKAEEAAELLANSLVEAAHRRYTVKQELQGASSGVACVRGAVRSKSSPTDISVESLTKIPGLPPRIAKRLVDEAGSIGSIRRYLGDNRVMRASRVRLFGRGGWNDALIEFLESSDPSQVLL